ncbi:pentatricopeptide repeat-containing protein At5g16860-like [Corylus avellana]|uniref:pentatricopeptide repeat-containing protein At5g16860-like n=1 Tax=Corylus avellana TaxID=13451 RepID=UPI00286BC041|nr:pentatricopeptide repeat-containing protein At5g16860-like [Corylus avellana]
MMFDSIAPEGRDVVTWTVMIGGYAQNGEANDVLELFSQMLGQESFLKPNAFTIACALVACSRLGALRFAMGHVPEMSFALHDVDDEEKGGLLLEHSEKLALAYGILTSPAGAPIRITKNLRVCGDCHTAITYISKIIDDEIILRDSSRFHHFRKGSCSCRG